MIIKEKSIKSYKGLENALRYVFTKTIEDSAFLFKRFIKGDRPLQALLELAEGNLEELSVITEKRIANMQQQFYENDKQRKLKRKNGVKFYHSILSFHKQDNLTHKQLLKVARKYTKERYPNSLAVFVPHFDKEHLHLHGLASSVEYGTGKTRHLTRKQFREVKERLESWQNVELGLKHSRVNHSKKKEVALLKDAEYQLNLKGKLSEKQQMHLKLAQVYNRAPSPEAFYNAVAKSGIELYERGGRISGIQGNSRRYRLKTLGFSKERIEALNHEQGNQQFNKRMIELKGNHQDVDKDKGLER